MKFTLSQIAAAAGVGGLDGNEVMHDLLILGAHSGGTPTLREYFVAHAPEHPQPWFKPVMPHPRPTVTPAPRDWSAQENRDFNEWRNDAIDVGQIDSPRVAAYVRQMLHEEKQLEDWSEDFAKQRFVQWPTAWADEQLRILTEKRRDEARKR